MPLGLWAERIEIQACSSRLKPMRLWRTVTAAWPATVCDDFSLKSKDEIETFIRSQPSYQPVAIDTFCSGSEAPIVGLEGILPACAFSQNFL